jgi:hypothetical protein
LPKERLVGFAASVPGVTPVPDSGILRLGLAPLDVMLMPPLAALLAVGANSTVKDVLCPAFSVSGTVSPLRLKPLPLALAAEMVRAVPPEFVSVSESDFELPTCTFPKLKLEGFGESWPCARPVPVRGTERAGLLAFELIVNAPPAAPAAVGAKMALKAVDCPALRVSGKVGPVKLNALPDAAALDIVAATPPVFVTVTDTVLLVPTVTLPKLALLGFAATEPGASPVPESAMLSGEPAASDTIASVVLAALAVAGAKRTVKGKLWFAASVTGTDSPLTKKPAPLTLACEMVTAVPPVLVRVPDLLALLPTCTLPKARLVGVAVNCPGATPVPEIGRTTSLEESVANVTFPVKFPPEVGANATLSGALFPACRVSGRARLLIENPAPLKVAWLTMRSVPPVLDRVTLLVLLDPTLILPKATDVGVDESCPGGGVVPPGGVEAPETVSDTSTSEFVPRREIFWERVSVAEG